MGKCAHTASENVLFWPKCPKDLSRCVIQELSSKGNANSPKWTLQGCFFVSIRQGSSPWLHHISLNNDSLTKCFEEVRQYRPKLGFGKEAKQHDSVVYCEVLGRALQAAVLPPPTLAAFNSLRSLLFSSSSFFFSFFFPMEAWQAE